MNKKWIFSIIIIMVMVCAMAAAGCGKKEETTKNKDEPKKEETKKEEADKAEPEKAEEPSVTEDKDTNKTKLDDADIEALKASIAESVKEYLEENKIAVEDFNWPGSDSSAWMYFGNLMMERDLQEITGEGEKGTSSLSPSGKDEEILTAVSIGFDNWYKASGVDNYEYFSNAFSVLQPYAEVIPAIEVK